MFGLSRPSCNFRLFFLFIPSSKPVIVLPSLYANGNNHVAIMSMQCVGDITHEGNKKDHEQERGYHNYDSFLFGALFLLELTSLIGYIFHHLVRCIPVEEAIFYLAPIHFCVLAARIVGQ